MTPSVDILIPVYNAEKYLRQCLDSVVNQTYGNIRVVIVDDGSTDSSRSICEEYASRYSFVEAVSQKNAGVATTRNRLLAKTKSDYFLFVDADDWVERNMIESMVSRACKGNLDITVCGHFVELTDNSQQDRTSQIHTDWDRAQSIEKFLYHQQLNGALWNKLIKTSVLGSSRFDADVSYGEDALFMWRILQNIRKLGHLNKPLYHYRMNDASISHQTFGAKKMSGHKVWATICADTCRDWPQYRHIARAAFAISDMWLLFYAALDKYPFDKNICHYQRHVRKNLIDIARAPQIKVNKKIFAIGMALSYRLGSRLIRKFI